MEFEKSDTAIGALVLAALAIFLGTLAAVNRGRLTAQTYRLEIQLPNIAGIDKGVEVLYKGYKAGEVDQVTLAYEPEFRFIVQLSIKREIRLKEGTSVSVRNKGFGGAKFLELSPPLEGEGGGMIEEGAVLPTVPEPDLMARANEVVGEVQKFVKDMQKGGTTAELQQTLRHGRSAVAHMDHALANLDGLLAENRAALKRTLQQTDELSSRANALLMKKDEALQKSLDSLQTSLLHLPSIMMNVEELTAELKRHPWRMIRKGDTGEAPIQVDHRHPPAVSTAPAAGPR